MARHYKKKPAKAIDWLAILISAIVDLIVGLILLLFEKQIK